MSLETSKTVGINYFKNNINFIWDIWKIMKIIVHLFENIVKSLYQNVLFTSYTIIKIRYFFDSSQLTFISSVFFLETEDPFRKFWFHKKCKNNVLLSVYCFDFCPNLFLFTVFKYQYQKYFSLPWKNLREKIDKFYQIKTFRTSSMTTIIWLDYLFGLQNRHSMAYLKKSSGIQQIII